MEEIIAPAYKAKDGHIYISRFAHIEIAQLFKEIDDKDIHKESIQGFITSYDRFVDRKEALEIAIKNNKNLKKICPSDELYSEDLFLNEQELQGKMAKIKTQLEQEKKKNKILESVIDMMAEEIILSEAECGTGRDLEDVKRYYFEWARDEERGN